jgi:hypothetical protein
MYRTTSVMALGLFLGLAPAGALAQTQTYETETQQQTTEPTAPETQQQATEPAAPETDEPEIATEPAAPETDEPEVATDVAEPAADDVIAVQEDDQILASSLIGSSVMLADESIGVVSDLIIGADNTLEGVVVGVGGFLGIGEKKGALPMEQITIQRIETGVVELAANTTREELDEAEPFKTAAQVRAEREAEQAEQQMQMEQPLTVD